jgi:hypothetical protein
MFLLFNIFHLFIFFCFYNFFFSIDVQVSPQDAISAYQLAIDMYNSNGRFATSARYYKEVADIYEKENDIPNAIINYRQVAFLMGVICKAVLNVHLFYLLGCRSI